MTSQSLTSPPLRWPGGKRRLLPEIFTRMPDDYNCLHEPFVGGGALSFALRPRGGFISDVNLELVNFYQTLKHRPRALINFLRSFKNTKEDFYKLRAQDRLPNFDARDRAWRAARYLFLNRTCFNGVMRVNAKGQLNCSYGTPVSDERAFASAPVWDAHRAMQAFRVSRASYDTTHKAAMPGDFVYFDPPYVAVNTLEISPILLMGFR